MDETKVLELWRSLAVEWAPLAGVRVKANGVNVPTQPNMYLWTLFAGTDDNFEDVQGAWIAHVQFYGIPRAMVPEPTLEQCRDYFRHQWIMAMISLTDMLCQSNIMHNKALAEAAAKAAHKQRGQLQKDAQRNTRRKP